MENRIGARCICVCAGTRPEIIKLAPVHLALKRRQGVRSMWIASGQHASLADRAMESFRISPDLRLKPPSEAASLGGRLAHLIGAYDQAFSEIAPDLVLVQGDTSTTAAAALAAFSRGTPVGHVEAGLRTFDRSAPFPEEAWRTIVGDLASLYFAPTERAAANLRRAGVGAAQIHVTGNTVIDALKAFPEPPPPGFLCSGSNRRVVGVTLHRRENWGEPVEQVMAALIRLRDAFEDVEIVFVRHANPELAGRVQARLAGEARITLVDPLDYPDFVALLRASYLMLSDSGGVQEEAPAFGTPVLVLRDTTERPEAVAAGAARLVGVETAAIVREAGRLLSDRSAHQAMARAVNPFGDGAAAERICGHIEDWFGAAAQPLRAFAHA